jgi:HPt (histidine-containing phosphotransfer) domain-containing protein
MPSLNQTPIESLAIVDPQVLQEFMEIAGPEVLADIVITYLGDAPKRLEAIEEAVNQDDGQQISTQAHALKSASKSVGLERVAQLCQSLELMGYEEDLSEADPTLAQLKQEYEQATQALKQDWLPPQV